MNPLSTQNRPGQHGLLTQPVTEHATHVVMSRSLEQPSVPQHTSAGVQPNPLAVQQRPPAQVLFAAQVVVQSPQWRGSVEVSVHN